MIALVVGAAMIAGYIVCVRAYDRRYPHKRFSLGRVGAFSAGVVLAAVMFLPRVDDLVDRSFAAHMAQHLALALIVPPLLLLGAPLLLAVAVPAPRAARAVARIARHPLLLALASPVVAWLLFVGVLWGIHFSPLYDLALRHEGAHVVEHTLLSTTALLFWLPVVQVGYSPVPVAFPVRLFYLFLAIPQGAFLGLAIYASQRVLYPQYLVGRSVASALADQKNAGAIMWIAGGAMLFSAFMLVAAVWAAREHREAFA